MSKGPTKARQALAEAREWIEASKEEVKEREAALVEAQGQLVMHETIYAILEKTLTRQPSAKAATKKSSKKSSKPASKSARASGMAAAISNSLSQQRRVAICAAMVDDNGGEMPCGEVEGNPIHDPTMGYAGYHEFQSAPVAHEASAGG